VTVYLIGPSQVGKSSAAASFAAPSSGIVVRDIDAELQRIHGDSWASHAFDWTSVEAILDAPSKAMEPALETVFVVGAGSQTLPELITYLRPHRDCTVLLIAPPEELIDRHPGRSLTELVRTEYTSRAELYDLAVHRLDVGGLAAEEVTNALRRFLARSE
jgi:shikimate kinase